jgi:hypothetical protein
MVDERRAMAGPERVEWRRRFPIRSVRLLAWYLAAAALVLAGVWLLFGSEPRRLASGQANPLADVSTWTAVLAAVGGLALLVPALRRPVVTADHYALQVRPGVWRLLVLPWANIAEVSARMVDDEPLLLVRLAAARGARASGTAARPGWWDRAVLRAARQSGRDSEELRGYDLAVRLRDFAGRPDAQLATLAAFAPDHVVFSNEL